MANTVNARITTHTGTAEQWETSNVILLKGEIGTDTTNNVIKIGDGVNLWKNLPHVAQELTIFKGALAITNNYLPIQQKVFQNFTTLKFKIAYYPSTALYESYAPVIDIELSRNQYNDSIKKGELYPVQANASLFVAPVNTIVQAPFYVSFIPEERHETNNGLYIQVPSNSITAYEFVNSNGTITIQKQNRTHTFFLLEIIGVTRKELYTSES